VKLTQQQRKKSNKVRVVAQAKDKADDGASPKWRVRYMTEADVDEVLRIQRLCYEPEYRELPESYVGRIRLYPQGNVIVEVPVIDNDTGDSSSDDEGSNDHQEVTKYSPSSSPPEDLRALHSVKKRRVAPACGQWRMAGYIQAQPFLREGVNDVNDLVDLEKWLADHRSPSSKLDHERDVVYIHEIAMDPAFRGQGLTAPLTDYVQQLTEDEGFQMMTLVSLGPALGFWKRNGFVLCRQLDYGGHDCYYMEKPLPVTDVDCNQPLADR
jgi:ribosomal protein S18 acetylase RimI-like enzyme